MGTGQTRGLGLALSLAVTALIAMPPAWAGPAGSQPFETQQPDGTPVTLRVRGDEFVHWYEDLDAYSVVVDNGRYVYAERAPSGRLVPTGLPVGEAVPRTQGLPPRLRPAPEVFDAARQRALPPASRAGERPPFVSPSGTVKNLVVLCKFKDHVHGTHTRPREDFDILFNRPGGHPRLAPGGSLRDYFLENSYGRFVIDSTILDWVTLPHTEAYYADGQSGGGDYPRNTIGMAEDALNCVDSRVDFGAFDENRDGYVDMLTIVHSGCDASIGGFPDRIWSVRWALWPLPEGHWVSADTNPDGAPVKAYWFTANPALLVMDRDMITSIAGICHETGHLLGSPRYALQSCLPDLYDLDHSSRGAGYYCLMADCMGFEVIGFRPQHLSAWCKEFLGWVEPKWLAIPGTYSVPQVEAEPVVYKIANGYSHPEPLDTEYLLIENRQPVGFDAGLPQGGLAIWHVDRAKEDNRDEGYPGQPGWPQNNCHYRVALLPADGDYDLERDRNQGDAGDLFRAGHVSRIDPTTRPSTDKYGGGQPASSYNAITDISASGPVMTFRYAAYHGESAAGDGSGTRPPTAPGVGFTVHPAHEGAFRQATLALPGGKATIPFAWVPQGPGNPDGFWMAACEISQALWEAVMGTNPGEFASEPRDLPVETVSWDDAAAFIERLNGMDAGTFRLPTRAQWEYACRAGADSDYHFGDDATRLGDYAWYAANSGGRPHPVGEKPPNAWGLHDMHGNVWEWCQDEAAGLLREQCGGGWANNAWKCLATARRTGPADQRRSDLGFRVIRDP
ncbi:MAG: M6 family metalloprotease domain-containing protein [Candidatus Hydrogenedentes bacterium]|nr:M6 family metalloprotease domain-containing protein [Candidatus Hydrogenedentota bacterium]